MPRVSNGNEKDLRAMATTLIDGGLVAIPTETVYGLAANAMNESAVQRLYKVKGRPKNHPVIVHLSKIDLLDFWAIEIPNVAKTLITNFWPGPLTLILKRSKNAGNWITGSQESVGLRMPKNQSTLLLLQSFHQIGGKGLAAPSANKFGMVSPTCLNDVITDIGNELNDSDWILDGGSCEIGIESTIVDCTQDIPIILRPGAVSKEMIESISGIGEIDGYMKPTKSAIRSPGSLSKHYSPKAEVRIAIDCKPGEGFIAMNYIPSPKGSIRLASPQTLEDFAKYLYSSLRKADEMAINSVVIVPPKGNGLAEAIQNRVYRSAGSP